MTNRYLPPPGQPVMARSSVQGARAGRRVPRPPGVWLALLVALFVGLFVGLAGLTGASVSAQTTSSADATLSALTVNSVGVSGFAAGRTSYEVGVASTVTTATVVATKNHAGATVAYSPGHQVSLSAGRNAVTVTVTAADGANTETYTVNINRGVTTPYGWKAADDFDTLKAADNTAPRGVWSDGTTMWVADFADPKLYAYRMSDQSRDSDKDFTLAADTNDTLFNNNGHPRGIWSDGTTMWVADYFDDKLYAYNLSTKARDSVREFELATGNGDAQGIWSDGTTMWVADHGDDKLYAYKMLDMTQDSDRDFILHTDNADPRGIWSDGTTMWVADGVDGKLYAYKMSDKTQDSARDFDTLSAAGNNNPNGIWVSPPTIREAHRYVPVSSQTIWVADDYDNKLYSYNMPSGDATLSALTVSPVNISTGAAEQDGPVSIYSSYEVGVASTVASATVVATKNHAGATVAYWPDDADTGTDGYQRSLSAGRNTVTITVTAESGATTETYTVNVNRGVTAHYGWKADDDFDTLISNQTPKSYGIWSDGTTMWVADQKFRELSAFTVSDQSPDNGKNISVHPGTKSITGIWSDGTTMWVADNDDDKLYAYNQSTNARDSDKDFTLDTDNGAPAGIWSYGTTMWVADGDDGKLYAYNLSTKARDSDKDFTLHTANADPTGIWSDGITMWVADSDDGKIYAYKMSDHGQVSARDFNTLVAAGNLSPTGIWSDGTTMWVADGDDRKLYSYNHPPSGDVTLSALTVNSVGVGGFAAERTSYEVGVASTVPTATVVATKNHAGATVAYSTTDADTGTDGHHLSLSAGRNTVTVTVTAEDGATTKTYRVNVNRGVTTPYGWKAADDFDTLVAAGNSFPQGLWSDGTTMRVADWREDKLFAYQMSDKTRDSAKDFTLHADNGDPRGIWSDGTTMWVVDVPEDVGKLFAYKMLDKTRDSDKEFTLHTDNGFSTGIWSDGTTMWVVDEHDIKIYAYQMSDKTRDSDKELTLHGKNIAPFGTWSDGTTMWVADWNAKKIFAYNLYTKASDSDREFNTLILAGNGAPTGIWSDGTTMFVADNADNKVYSYNHPFYVTAATADGTSLVITVNRTLGAAAGLANDAFTVKRTSGGSEETAALSATTAPAISGKTVTLTLASALAAGDIVKVSYTKPTTGTNNKIVDAAGNELAGFTDQAVNNHTRYVAISNLEVDPSHGDTMVSGTSAYATSFTTGTEPEGYTLHAVRMEISATSTVNFSVSIYKDSSDSPGEILDHGDLTNPTSIDEDLSTREEFTASTPLPLSASTTYWVVISRTSGTGVPTFTTAARNAATVGLPGWVLGESKTRTSPSTSWTDFGGDLQIEVLADVNPSLIGWAISSSPLDGDTYRQGENIEIEYTFNVPVEYVGGAAAFRIGEDSATNYRPASYVSGSGSRRLLYSYDVQRADTDTDGISVDSNSLGAESANTITYGAGGAAHIAHAQGLDEDSGHKVSGAATSCGFALCADLTAAGSATVIGAIYYETSNQGSLSNRSFWFGGRYAIEQLLIRNSNKLELLLDRAPGRALLADGFIHLMRKHAFRFRDGTVDGHRVTWDISGVTWEADSEYRVIIGDFTKEYGWNPFGDFNTLSAADNEGPTGIWSDGTTMWVADNTDDKLYAYTVSDMSRDSAKDFNTLMAAGNEAPQGIWSDGTTMWVADNDDRKLYAYNLSTKARDDAKDFTLHTDQSYPVGIWSDGITMWVADFWGHKLYAYNLSTKARDGGKDFNTLTAAGNEAPQGIWSDGTTMWVADWEGNKLYAYNLSTKARDSDKDFNTLSVAGNNDPQGIWSDGTTMWVADSGDDKVYSYNLPSADATLSALTVNSVGVSGFAAQRTSYQVGVASTATTATVVATKNNPGATVAYSPADADTGTDGYQRSLSAGRNTVTITVTAEDGATTETYTVSVNRGVTAEYGWKAADDFDTLVAAGNNLPRGVWSDGTTMWVLDWDDDKIYAYTVSDQSRDPARDFSLHADNGFPYGIWSDGTTMWVADNGDDKLYAYNLSSKSRDSARDFSLHTDNGFPYGIWSDGTTIWVGDAPDGKLYAYQLSDQNRDSARDLSLHTDNGNPLGIWSDGATMWVADWSDAKVYAYQMSDRSRDSDRDFNTLSAAGNGGPTGIWSDGTTMWVADSGDGKLYSYNHPFYVTAATANGTSLVITVNRTLGAAASLANGAFTVKRTPSGGSEETVNLSAATAPSISGRTVTLTLDPALAAGDTNVKVSYSKPTTGTNNKIVDRNGNELAGFTDLAVTVEAGPQPPVFAEDSDTMAVPEDAAPGTVVGTVKATDPNSGDTLTYSVDGTAAQRDAFNGVFELGASSGEITVKAGDRDQLDYETRRQYSVRIVARDPGGLSGTMALVIRVNNIEEPGSVTFTFSPSSPSVPTAGNSVTASLTDPDGGVTGVTWQWSKSETETGTYTDISGASSATYTPVNADLNAWLKATATYTDGHGAGKTEYAVTGPVEIGAKVRGLTAEVWPGTGSDKTVDMRVELEWTAAQGVSSYTIMRRDHERDRVVGNVRRTTYMDEGLQYGSEVTYVVYPSTAEDPPSVNYHVAGSDVVSVFMYEPRDAELYPNDFEIHRASGSNSTFTFTWSRPEDPRLQAWVDYELVRAPALSDNTYTPDEEAAVPVVGTSDTIADGVYFYILRLRIGPEWGYGYTPGGSWNWRVDTTQNPAVIE